MTTGLVIPYRTILDFFSSEVVVIKNYSNHKILSLPTQMNAATSTLIQRLASLINTTIGWYR